MKAYDMNECPDYVALSYQWGSEEPYKDILLNGVRTPVGRNLWTFLYSMSRQSGPTKRRFWIDAICINQSNIAERNQQVQEMRRIYSRAESVFIWLGHDKDDTLSNDAMDYLLSRKLLKPGLVGSNKELWNQSQATALLALCENPYWHRMWIIQEIVLARKAFICYGSKKVSWGVLVCLLFDAATLKQRSPEGDIPHLSAFLASPAAAIAKVRQDWTGKPQPLFSLLRNFYRHEATELRDKVYALHGLALEAENLHVDYHITPEELFKQVILHTIPTDEDLCRKIANILEVDYPEDEMRRHFEWIRGPSITASPELKCDDSSAKTKSERRNQKEKKIG
jgi:hypothetical protein